MIKKKLFTTIFFHQNLIRINNKTITGIKNMYLGNKLYNLWIKQLSFQLNKNIQIRWCCQLEISKCALAVLINYSPLKFVIKLLHWNNNQVFNFSEKNMQNVIQILVKAKINECD